MIDRRMFVKGVAATTTGMVLHGTGRGASPAAEEVVSDQVTIVDPHPGALVLMFDGTANTPGTIRGTVDWVSKPRKATAGFVKCEFFYPGSMIWYWVRTAAEGSWRLDLSYVNAQGQRVMRALTGDNVAFRVTSFSKNPGYAEMTIGHIQ